MTSFGLKLNEERFDALMYAAKHIERREGLDEASDVLDLEDMIRQRYFDLEMSQSIPLALWPALDQLLDQAKHVVWKTDRRYLIGRHSKLKKLLGEDAVTRLGRLNSRTSAKT